MPVPSSIQPETFVFADDGSVPNNAKLPFLIYRDAIDLKGSPNPEEVVERAFAANHWGDMWRNGIYPYVHYHSTIHEAMGIARGRAKVRFGGNGGPEIDLFAGDDLKDRRPRSRGAHRRRHRRHAPRGGSAGRRRRLGGSSRG